MAGACYVAAMSKTPERMIAGFTTGERDYIRREPAWCRDQRMHATIPTRAWGQTMRT